VYSRNFTTPVVFMARQRLNISFQFVSAGNMKDNGNVLIGTCSKFRIEKCLSDVQLHSVKFGLK
jgi:dihydroxyacid dehydratase/phosphogluconate dehydratase